MEKRCENCVHRTTYSAVTNPDDLLYICTGDNWDDNGDGSYNLVEVSEFDPKDCIFYQRTIEREA